MHREAQLGTGFAEQRLALPGGALLCARRTPGAGRGTPLLLLHGISSGAASWLGVAQALAAHGREAVAWDAPGYGASTPLDTDAPTAADYAGRARALLDALALPRVHLVGHSLGAIVATALATQLGAARIASLTLVSPARGYGADAAAADRVRAQRLEALRERGIAGLAATLGQRLLSARASAEQHAQLRATAERMTERGYAQAIELLVRSDLPTLARQGHGLAGLPLAVWVGSEDVVTPPAACAALADALHAPLHTLPGAGHACAVEQPEALAQALATLND